MSEELKSQERNRIEITVPNAKDDEIERVRRALAFAVGFEFRVLANKRDHDALIQKAADSFPKPVVIDSKVRARWLPIAKTQRKHFSSHGDVIVRSDRKKAPLVLVVQDAQNVTSADLVDVRRTDDGIGHAAIGFTLSREGGQRFEELTAANLPSADGFRRRLGIVIDGELYAAPNLLAQIGRKGMITGRFTDEEVDSIMAVLRAGPLPARLKGPVSDGQAK